MMKRLLITLILGIMLSASSVSAFEALGSGSFGWLTMKGQRSVTAYSVGFGIPLVEKQSIGFILKTDIDYLYSDGFGGVEVQVTRIYLGSEKNVMSSMRTIPDPNKVGATIEELVWRWYFLTGSGTWQFIKTGLEDGNDQSFGAFKVGTGGEFKGFSLKLAVDIVQVPGPDIIYPNVAFNVTF